MTTHTHLWALAGTLPPDPTAQEKLGTTLTQHSQVTSLLLVRQQVGDQARSFLATEGCGGCLQHHCEVGCRTDLLRRTLAATGDTITLRHIPLGLTARPYTQRWLAWPTKTTAPPGVDLLDGMQEARLVLHWSPGLLPRAPATLCALLLAGAEDTDGAERLRAAGWQVLTVPAFMSQYRDSQGMPPTLPPGRTPVFAPLPLLPSATPTAADAAPAPDPAPADAALDPPWSPPAAWTLADPLGQAVQDLQHARAVGDPLPFDADADHQHWPEPEMPAAPAVEPDPTPDLAPESPAVTEPTAAEPDPAPAVEPDPVPDLAPESPVPDAAPGPEPEMPADLAVEMPHPAPESPAPDAAPGPEPEPPASAPDLAVEMPAGSIWQILAPLAAAPERCLAVVEMPDLEPAPEPDLPAPAPEPDLPADLTVEPDAAPASAPDLTVDALDLAVEPDAAADAGTLPWDAADDADAGADGTDFPDAEELQLLTDVPYRLKNGREATARHAWKLGAWMVHAIRGGWSLTDATSGQQQQKFSTKDAAMEALHAMPTATPAPAPPRRPPPPPPASRRNF